MRLRGVPETETETPPFVNVTHTDDGAAGVLAPITTVNVVAVAYVHKATTPSLGPTVAPTLAVHEELVKFVPITVMVLRAYAAVGKIDVAV